MKNIKKSTLLILSTLTLCAFGIVGSMSWMVTHTLPVQNNFTAASVKPEISEEFNGEVKKNVYIQNQGSVNVYVRAAIELTWIDEDNNIYSVPPQPEHYEMDLNLKSAENTESNWIKAADGYYYYLVDVEPGGVTQNLINECQLVDDVVGPVGYNFCVDVIAQTIQADPDIAVEESWTNSKITVDSNAGELTITAK